MSSIDWEFVQKMAAHKAKQYAIPKTLRNFDDLYNGYYDGYMESAGERESLRAINERQRLRILELEGSKGSPAPSGGQVLASGANYSSLLRLQDTESPILTPSLPSVTPPNVRIPTQLDDLI